MRRGWRNFAHAILPMRKFFFHASWNSIPTICWPKCICSALSNTNKLRPTKRGKRSKCSKRNKFFHTAAQRLTNVLSDFVCHVDFVRGQNKGWQNHRRRVEECA